MVAPVVRQPAVRAFCVAGVIAPLVLGAAACSSDPEPTLAPTPVVSSSAPTPSPTPSPSPTPVPRLSGGPVLAVKIDNTSGARPRIGHSVADVIYIEPVEGGLTRLLAVFSTKQPSRVGPVRSGRETDVTILANYGKVAFAYSGSSWYSSSILAKGSQVNLAYDSSTRGYTRDRSRPAPYNIIGFPTELLKRAKGSVKPADPGFRYGAAPAGGRATKKLTATWPAARFTATYSGDSYAVSMDGRREKDALTGKGVSPKAVIVQYVTVRMSGNRDVNGNPTPVETLTGTGKGVLLRDGKSWPITWSRKSPTAPTVFKAGEATAMLPKGQVWVLLVDKGRKVTLSKG